MKKAIILTFAGIATISSPAMAGEADVTGACNSIGEFSRTIMTGRQHGAPIAKMMAILAGLKLPPETEFPYRKTMKAIILAAYKEPHFTMDPYRQNAINDFVDNVERTCYEANQ